MVFVRYVLYSCVMMLMSCAFAVAEIPGDEAGAAVLKSAEPIPVLAWSGLPMHLSTVERFKELREAGFTHHLQSYGKIEDVEKVLEIAEKTDVKIIANIIKTMPMEDYIERVKTHEAFYGYLISDEPNALKFEEIARKVKEVQALDSENICYVNLLPTYGGKYLKAESYEAYVDSFLSTVPVKLLSYDHYPIFSDHGTLKTRPDFYENLEIIREQSIKHDKPFWAFALTTSHWGYPIPTVAHLRYQVFSNLAYGAVGIQYFTYWTLKISKPNAPVFSSAPLAHNGNRTVVYDRVKQVNAEIQGLAGVFMGSKVVDVSHIGDTIPQGTKQYEAANPFLDVNTNGKGAVVSQLVKGDRHFMVVVNSDIQNYLNLDIEIQDDAHVSTVNKSGMIEPIELTQKSFQIEPGDIQVFTWLNPLGSGQ